MKRKKEEIFEKIIKSRITSNHIEFNLGGCCKFLKETKKHYVFKSCYDGNVFYIDKKNGCFDDFDGKIFAYLLKKNKKLHHRFDGGISLFVEDVPKNKMTKKQLKKEVFKLIKIFGSLSSSDIAEILDVDFIKIHSVMFELEKEKRIRCKK